MNRRVAERLARHLVFPAFMTIAVLPSAAMLVGLAVVARHSDIAEWSALGVGGSIGGLGALVVLFGWRLTGPVEVARADASERRRLYTQSVADRSLLLLALLPPGVAIGSLVAPDGARWTAAMMVVATSLNGTSALWFAVGVGDPWLCLRLETVPRVVTALVGAGAVAGGAPLWIFPLALAAGTLLGGVLTSSRILSGELRAIRKAFGSVRGSLRSQRRAAVTEITAGAYSAGSVAVVGSVATAGVTATFVSADRLFRASLIPVSALSSSLQRGVSEAAPSAFRRMALRALVAHMVLGLVGLAVLLGWGSKGTTLLFGDTLSAQRSTMAAYGAAFLAVSLNTTLGRHVLASQGRTNALLVGTCAGAVVGVVSLVVGTTTHGVTGAAVGVALGEAATLLVFAAACLRRPAGSLTR